MAWARIGTAPKDRAIEVFDGEDRMAVVRWVTAREIADDNGGPVSSYRPGWGFIGDPMLEPELTAKWWREHEPAPAND